jgi:N-acetyl-1-D-myo-inositol-2-amino-2-deoxy-alpha-D-glucopyranoside deacetylase
MTDSHQRVLIAVHAHPDDECILTGGVLAKYAADGVRTVLVTCTDGAVGEISDPSLATPETLVEVRSRELDESVRIINVSRLEKLGYRDSGMAGTADNDHPASFQQANFDDAVGKVVRIMREEQPQVVVTYDENGNYGHPDHIRAHQVAVAAFDASADPNRYPDAGPPFEPSRLFYAVVPRSAFGRMGERLRQAGIELPWRDVNTDNPPQFGVEEDRVTTIIDAEKFAGAKLDSMLAHRTQLGENMFFARLPRTLFEEIFARESYQLVRGNPEGTGDDLFAGLTP